MYTVQFRCSNFFFVVFHRWSNKVVKALKVLSCYKCLYCSFHTTTKKILDTWICHRIRAFWTYVLIIPEKEKEITPRSSWETDEGWHGVLKIHTSGLFGTLQEKQFIALTMFKGSVSQDFRPPVFLMIRTHLGP